jgi:hypothetical protein
MGRKMVRISHSTSLAVEWSGVVWYGTGGMAEMKVQTVACLWQVDLTEE